MKKAAVFLWLVLLFCSTASQAADAVRVVAGTSLISDIVADLTQNRCEILTLNQGSSCPGHENASTGDYVFAARANLLLIHPFQRNLQQVSAMGACPPSCCRCWGLGITTRLRVACLSAFSAGSSLTSVLLTATAASDSDRTSGAACSPGFCTVGDSPPAADADAACLERPVCPTAVLPTSTKLTTTAPPGSTAPCLASSAPKPSMQATTSPCKIRDTPTPLARIRLQLRGGGLFSSSKATSRPHALKPPNTRLSLVCYYLYNHNTD